MSSTRRHFLKQSLAATAACLMLPSCTKKSQPNIIYIMADDLGYSDLGCFGQKQIQTPHIDQMAQEGIKFTQHYAGSSVCAPSRSVLMTGQHTGHAYIRGNKEDEPYGQLQLPSGTITVASLLKSAGYKTGIFGKWGMGVEHTPGDPQNHGFDEFYGYYCQVHAHNSFPEYLYHNGEKVKLNNTATYMPKDHWTRGLGSYSTEKNDYSNDFIFTAAMNFIDKNQNEPFFCYLPVTMPHDNGEAPEGERIESPTLGQYTEKPWKDDDKRYAALVSRLDAYVGKLIARLQELGIDENTIVFFTSDNGALLNPVFECNGILRGGKRDLYEGGVRAPMIVRWPGTIAAQTETDHISAFWDFLPTACELAGIATPAQTDGISYLPTLLAKPQKKHEFLYWEFYWWNPPYVAVRMGTWKGIYFFEPEEKDHFELYDLEADVREERECSAEHPDIVTKIKAIMREQHTPSEFFVLPEFEV